ncbi:cytochrome p450 family protein [Planoprotostelium fungivorum]|uniref:Cytochrome p450 family protein n=1 Tax=Planoprotostelium fungivorum TaxID=1890364 RepID=A0A2P6N7W3_9EUKA|nr:cytochrome p450 family protein [Planoprotostelium fungivorum]
MHSSTRSLLINNTWASILFGTSLGSLQEPTSSLPHRLRQDQHSKLPYGQHNTQEDPHKCTREDKNVSPATSNDQVKRQSQTDNRRMMCGQYAFGQKTWSNPFEGLYDEGRRVSDEAVVYGVWPPPANFHGTVCRILSKRESNPFLHFHNSAHPIKKMREDGETEALISTNEPTSPSYQTQKITSDDVSVDIQTVGWKTGKKSRSCHFSVLLVTLLFFGAIAGIIVAFIIAPSDSWIPKIPPIVASVILFIIYWTMVLTAETYNYLKNFVHTDGFFHHIQTMKVTPPTLVFRCECYHYETRTVYGTESYTDSNGRSQTRRTTRTETVKVVSFRDSEEFRYSHYDDRSGDLSDGVARFNIVRVEMTQGWVAGDNYTQNEYLGQKNHFICRNQGRDTHFSQWDDFGTPGFRSNMMCALDPTNIPKMLSSTWYILFSLFFLTWIYRIWFDRVSVSARFHFVKAIYRQPIVQTVTTYVTVVSPVLSPVVQHVQPQVIVPIASQPIMPEPSAPAETVTLDGPEQQSALPPQSVHNFVMNPPLFSLNRGAAESSSITLDRIGLRGNRGCIHEVVLENWPKFGTEHGSCHRPTLYAYKSIKNSDMNVHSIMLVLIHRCYPTSEWSPGGVHFDNLRSRGRGVSSPRRIDRYVDIERTWRCRTSSKRFKRPLSISERHNRMRERSIGVILLQELPTCKTQTGDYSLVVEYNTS